MKDKYEIMLEVLTEKIHFLKSENYIKDIQIEALKKQLAEAEYHLDPTPANEKRLKELNHGN